MPGIVDCERIEREHAKAFAAVSPDVREEARRYADLVLMERGWLRADTPTKRLTEQELERFHVMIHGSTDYTEELVQSARLALPDELTDASLAELKLDPPLMEDCLTQSNCECHHFPDHLQESLSKISDDIAPVASSDQTVLYEEKNDHPAPTLDKNKGVDTQIVVYGVGTSHDENNSLREPKLVFPLGPRALSPTSRSAFRSARQANCQAGPSSLASSTACQVIQEGENVCPTESISAGPRTYKKGAECTEMEGKGHPCQWKKYFRGSCNFVGVDHQRHDRHLITHIPDDKGYQITPYRCRWPHCGREFSRRSSFRRHVTTVHRCQNPNDHLEVPAQPWWYPKDLFLSNAYRMLPRESQPLENKLIWYEKIRDIFNKRGIAAARKRAEGDATNSSTNRSCMGPATSSASGEQADHAAEQPPAKRRKAE